MSTVVHLPSTQTLVADEPVERDEDALTRAAMTAFQEAADGGCSLRDCLLSVYLAGQQSITGYKPKPRPRKAALPPCPYTRVVDLFHEVLPELPGVRLMDDKRRRVIRDMWAWVLTSKKKDGTPRAADAEAAMAWIRRYFVMVSENDFLMGRAKRSAGHENWRPDLDYLLSTRGMKQVLEKGA